jgi:hypothetical protein
MGYRQAKKQALECLADGRIEHELDRCEIDIKNLLLTGVVAAKQVADAIGRSSGKEYECSPHHYDENIDVHIIKTQQGDRSWYIKWYFIAPNVVFISVHE